MVQDSFEVGDGAYATGELIGQNPAISPFDGPWTGDTTRTYVSGTGLQYTLGDASVLGTGGGLIKNGGFLSEGDGEAFRSTSLADDQAGIGERWFSALLYVGSGTGGNNDGVKTRLDFDNDGGNTIAFGLIPSTTTFSWVGDKVSGYAMGTTALAIGKMLVNSTADATDESFKFWFNPTDISSESQLDATAQVTQNRAWMSFLFSDPRCTCLLISPSAGRVARARFPAGRVFRGEDGGRENVFILWRDSLVAHRNA